MRALFRIWRICLVVCLCLTANTLVASAQCTSHPSHETTVSVINASQWPIIFSVDGVTRATIPAVTVSDFHLSPGQHFLVAETSIEGEVFSIDRKLVVPAGSMCVWTVTDPTKNPRRPLPPFIDPLTRVAVISLAIPAGM
jgi:hypothetical protein